MTFEVFFKVINSNCNAYCTFEVLYIQIRRIINQLVVNLNNLYCCSYIEYINKIWLFRDNQLYTKSTFIKISNNQLI